ncbi:MAG: Uncharacterised protein [Flavobacteriaceae bacterium]|nr:MAG: Uncharacterised protein [Flavobacteriaceae bacterium]
MGINSVSTNLNIKPPKAFALGGFIFREYLIVKLDYYNLH